MAILIIEQPGQRQAGTLKGRVLVGRWPDNTVVIDDRAVSRIHAWIGLQDGRYYIADAGSRTGTFVNGEALRERHVLLDGDQIRIGPAVLRYRTDSAPPTEAEEIDLSPRTAAQLSGDQGIFMECVCGAPLWLPREFAGIGQCRYCGHTVTQGIAPAGGSVSGTRLVSPPAPAAAAPAPIKRDAAPGAPRADEDADDFNAMIDDALAAEPPRRPAKRGRAATPIPSSAVRPPPVPKALAPKVMPAIAPTSPQAPPPPVRRTRGAVPAIPAIPPAVQRPQSPAAAQSGTEQDCGVCHAPITVFDEITFCPSCGLSFHAECWEENRGCSAYGCTQVGALGQKPQG